MTDDPTIEQRYARLLTALGCSPDEHAEAVIAVHHVTMRDRFVERDAKRFVAALPTDYDGMRAVALKFWRQVRHAEDEATRARDKAHRFSSAMGEIAAENKRLRARVADAEAEAIRRTDEIVAIGRALGCECATAEEILARLNTPPAGDVEGA